MGRMRIKKILLVVAVWFGACLLPLCLFAAFAPMPWREFSGALGVLLGIVATGITLEIKPAREWRRKPSRSAKRRAWLKSGR